VTEDEGEEASLRQEREGGDGRDEQVDDVTEDEEEEEASLRQGRDGRDEQVDDATEDEHEGKSCSTECSGRTGRRLAHFEGDEVARRARCRLSGDRKL
jgi:hypothetical protein